MQDFHPFKEAVQRQIAKMQDLFLFEVHTEHKNELWDHYLASFPPGTNPIFRERTHHDCACCRHFIRDMGNVVAIDTNNEYITIWDVHDHPDLHVQMDMSYQIVAMQLAKLVRERHIVAPFLHYSKKVGTDHNHEMIDGKSVRWDHFSCTLGTAHVAKKNMIPRKISGMVADFDVFARSMGEIDIEAAQTVLELIAQNSLYRGQEHRRTVENFIGKKMNYDMVPEELQGRWCWVESRLLGPAGRFRNTVIGTLMTDLSEGRNLEDAVKDFESKVAPENYKRTTALITKTMIKQAQEKCDALGLTPLLARRYARIDDISVNNVIWADRGARKAMDSVFDELAEEHAPVEARDWSHIEELPVDEFVANVLPHAKKVSILLESKHEKNLVSLIAPGIDVANGTRLFKWDNNFSWAYKGDIADSTRELVRKAGGDVTGILRFSIRWNDKGDNRNDYDAHCEEPNGNLIYYPNKGHKHPSTGMLDVDIINPGTRVAVENITYTNRNKMANGTYKFMVHCYDHCGGTNGFSAEIEFEGQIHEFSYPRNLAKGKKILVAEVYKAGDRFYFGEKMKSSEQIRYLWGLKTHQFHRVATIMKSPNHWDGNATGNRHMFFMLDGCRQEGMARGFFNEFMRQELVEHRKVFEVLGGKMKTPVSTEQLSGLGFSSTQHNTITCRVEGNIDRVMKVTF